MPESGKIPQGVPGGWRSTDAVSYTHLRFRKNNTVPKNILTRNEYYLLLDEIHGVECNLIVNYYRHKKKLESETSHVPIEKGNL